MQKHFSENVFRNYGFLSVKSGSGTSTRQSAPMACKKKQGQTLTRMSLPDYFPADLSLSYYDLVGGTQIFFNLIHCFRFIRTVCGHYNGLPS